MKTSSVYYTICVHPQLVGYRGRARVMVSLVSDTDPPVPHAHSIVGKNLRIQMQEFRVDPGRQGRGGGSAAPPPFATFCIISIFLFAYLVLG